VDAAAEHWYARMVETSDVPMMIVDRAGKVVAWNPAAARAYGYSADEMLGRDVHALVPPDRRAESEQLLADGFAGRATHGFETLRVRRDGTKLEVMLHCSPIPDASGNIVGVGKAVHDLTQRRQAEERFRAAVEACPSGMLMLNADGAIVLANHALERQFGYTRSELLGMPLARLVPGLGHHAQSTLSKGTEEAQQGRVQPLREFAGRRSDGSEFPLEIGLTPVPVRTETYLLAVVVDVSARKEAEHRAQLQRTELERSNRDLQQFAYVASHDLQEPLRMVVAYTELLSKKYGAALDEKAKKYIFYAADGARRMQQLVRDLLLFSRVDSDGRPPTPTAPSPVLAEVLRALWPMIRESGADVQVGPLPPVLADATQLHQIFQNLIGNAIKFRSERAPAVWVSAKQTGDEVTFSVADNGIGIADKYRERIFMMFQRLHDRSRYDGSGIGLAIVQRIVERHGGRVWLESEESHGTTFHFTLHALPSG
jgi:PAS domain S-box-containing protein